MSTTLTGQYGFVLRLPPDIEDGVRELSREYAGNELDFSQVVPHCTCFHTYLADAPVDHIREIHTLLNASLPISLDLHRFDVYGEVFVFWDATITAPLRMLYDKALGLARYHCSGDGKGEKLRNLPARQLENIRRYGHPLVGEDWRPHVTVAYNAKGIAQVSRATLPVQCTIRDAAFAKIGHAGSVTEVVPL